MVSTRNNDASNGYDSIAVDFMSIRGRSSIGANTVRSWSKSLRAGGAVLDLGCGHGIPISKLLLDEGFSVYGIDASPRMIAAFRENVPQARATCESIEDSKLFGQQFDGIVAWGLLFLLAPATQIKLIHKVASALNAGGRFLFTAPHQECEWLDNLTKRNCISLGSTAYRRILESEGLTLLGDSEDEGENYYFFACKPGQRNSDERNGANA